MRGFFMMVLLVLFAAVGILALEKRGDTTVHYFGQSVTCAQSFLIAGVYLAGMVSGWFLIGFGRRLIHAST